MHTYNCGDTALHLAVEKNNLELIKERARQITIEGLAKGNKSGHTAFFLAVKIGTREVIKELAS